MRAMKRVVVFLLTAIFILPVKAQFTSATLQASGLTCALCSRAVNKALQNLSFVATVKPDIKNSSFNVIFKENGDVNIDELKEAVEDAGFSVANLKITGNFENVRLLKDQYTKIGNQVFYFLNADNKVLNGERTFMIVEKNFMTANIFKKYSALLKTESPQSLKPESNGNKTRIYHVII
jgi:copper chaperone CopZ